VKRPFVYSLPFAAAAAILLVSSAANAATIANVAVQNIDGGNYNTYDPINGSYQHLSGGGTVSLGFTPGTTSASASLSGSILFGGITDTFSSLALANLATGSIGVSATDAGGAAFAEAMLQDSVTFNNTTGHAVNIDVLWTFDGTTYSPVNFVQPRYASYFCFGGIVCQAAGGIPPGGSMPQPGSAAFNRFDYTYAIADNGIIVTNPDPVNGTWVSSSYTSSPSLQPNQLLPAPGTSDITVTFDGVFSIPAGLSTDYVYANLQVDCGGGGPVISGVRSGGGSCDFSHTGALSFGGLNGISFTSGSNALLTQPGSAAPEPGSWILMMAGLGLVGLAKLRVARNPRAV
jgi:hypothetical protein